MSRPKPGTWFTDPSHFERPTAAMFCMRAGWAVWELPWATCSSCRRRPPAESGNASNPKPSRSFISICKAASPTWIVSTRNRMPHWNTAAFSAPSMTSFPEFSSAHTCKRRRKLPTS